jgi:hypothetical protein
MKLTEINSSLPALSLACHRVEAKVQGVQQLSTLTLQVESLPNFNNRPEASKDAFRNSPAAYVRSENKIIVNNAKFSLLAPEVAEATLAHEVGHAFCNLYPPAHLTGRLTDVPEVTVADIVADYYACDWGFLDGICEARKNKPQYCDILARRQDPEVFCEEMLRWNLKRIVINE